MKKLRIGYFADGPWSHLAFEKIINDSRIEIALIVPRFDSKDNTLENYSKKYDIDYIKFKNINSSDSIKTIKSYNCDLLVSMSFNQIFKKEIINLTPLKIINCHAGKLPFYRGRNVLNWALINDENEFGITVHYVDEGIDSGDIILQRTFGINDRDNYKTLLEVAYKECANILYDSLQKFLENNVTRLPQSQIHTLGTYCGRRVEGDEIINWRDSSRNIFNFIRSICSPGPQARSFINGKVVKINQSKYFSEAPIYIGIPGQVIKKTSKGYLIKTGDSYLEIFEVNISLKVGDRLVGKKIDNSAPVLKF